MSQSKTKVRGRVPKCLSGGAGSKMLTVRMSPETYARIAAVSRGKSQSMNAFALSVLEGAVSLIERKDSDDKNQENLYLTVSDDRRAT